MTWPVHQISPRPWAAVCATCGHVDRSATKAGAIVCREAHLARNKGHQVGVVERPDSGRSGVLLLLAVVVLVVLVAGGVATGLTAALDDLTAGWPTTGGRP